MTDRDSLTRRAIAGLALGAIVATLAVWYWATPAQVESATPPAAIVAAPVPSAPAPLPAVRAIVVPVGDARILSDALRAPLASIDEAENIVDEGAASLRFQDLVTPAKLATPASRATLLAMLGRAEEVANLRIQITERNLETLRAAAEAAAITNEVRREFLKQLDDEARHTLESAEQLREAQLRVVSAGRRLIGFMDDSQANYQLDGSAVSFQSEGEQVQFTHFLSQTDQIVRREAAARGAADVARRQQRQLLQSFTGAGT